MRARYKPSADDPFLGPTLVGAREDAFATWVRKNSDLGFGRMMQIISRIWDEAVPGIGSAHFEAAHNQTSWISFCVSLGKTCSQCGLAWRARACGPTHAAIAAARAVARNKTKAGKAGR